VANPKMKKPIANSGMENLVASLVTFLITMLVLLARTKESVNIKTTETKTFMLK